MEFKSPDESRKINLLVDQERNIYGGNDFEMAVIDFVNEKYRSYIDRLTSVVEVPEKTKIKKLCNDLRNTIDFMSLKESDNEIRNFDYFGKAEVIINLIALNKAASNLKAFLNSLYEECMKKYPEYLDLLSNKKVDKELDIVIEVEPPKEDKGKVTSVKTNCTNGDEAPIDESTESDGDGTANDNDNSQMESYFNQIRSEFLPPSSSFANATPDNFITIYNEYNNEHKDNLLKSYTEAYIKNNTQHALSVIESLNKQFALMGYKLLEVHLKQMITNLKNISSEKCIIYPEIIKKLVSDVDEVSSKVKKSCMDNNKIFKKANASNKILNVIDKEKTDRIGAIDITEKNSSNAINLSNSNLSLYIKGNPLSKQTLKDKLSPTNDAKRIDFGAQIEKELYSKIKPVSFSGLIKKPFNYQEPNEIVVFSIDHLDDEKQNDKKKRNINENIFTNYPFKQEKPNCFFQ